jgi:hypothetical protein
LPPLIKISLRAHLLLAVALFMLYLGKNGAWRSWAILIRVIESTNYTHENTGSGQNFSSTNDMCEFIPKPPYLSGIVAYEDDQMAIFYSSFT